MYNVFRIELTDTRVNVYLAETGTRLSTRAVATRVAGLIFQQHGHQYEHLGWKRS